MRRDPYQQEPTAYDRLGVELGALGQELEAAASADGAAASDAEREVALAVLADPASRALEDLFLYQDSFLDELAFNEPIGVLAETPARRRIDEHWQEIERRGFPIPSATHSIAVLSYWDARSGGRAGADLPTPPDVIARLRDGALCRYAALAASPDFWVEWGRITGNRGNARAMADALERRLEDELLEIAARLRERGDVHGEERCREHVALFQSELRAARSLPDVKPLAGRALAPVAIRAGPYLLGEVDLLDKVRAAVGAQHPDLLPYFSPLAHIALLVEDREHGAALSALGRLVPDERDGPEAHELEARARLGAGMGALAVDRVDEAVSHWERAMELAGARSEVAVPVSEAVLARAKLFRSREDSDAAIALLQRALPLGERTLLGVPLAFFLAERAEARVRRAAESAGVEDADLAPAIAEARGAVADLEEAVVLDPTNGEIRDRRNDAADLLAALIARAGPATVEPEGRGEAPADEAAAPVEAGPAATRSSPLVAIGVALWIGIGLVAFVAYPLLMPRYLGQAGTIIAAGVALGWIATNAVGWFLLR